MSRAARTPQTQPADRSCWPGQATRADRRAARKDIVLADVGVSKNTQVRYFTAVSRLKHLLPLVQSESHLDDLVAGWIQTEFEDGTPLYLIADALSGLHHLEPYTKKKLCKSWHLYSIWRKYEVPCRAPPLPQDIVLAMAGWCLTNGELVMAALLLVGFHCLLRTGEILSIRPIDFLLDKAGGLLSLPSSKSGLRNNSRESVSISDPLTIQTVTAMLDCKYSMHMQHVPCWDKSASSFRSLFQNILEQFELSSLNFRPYSLRRGGATYEMQTHGLMEKTLIRGRWKNSNIARIYICDGLALLPRLRMSWCSKQLVASYSAVFTAEHRAFSKSRGERGEKRTKRV